MKKRSDRVKLKYCRTNSKEKITAKKLFEFLIQAYHMSGDINGTIGKSRNRRHRDLVEFQYDQEKLRSDWYNVGQDINKAIKEYDLSHIKNYRYRDIVENNRNTLDR